MKEERRDTLESSTEEETVGEGVDGWGERFIEKRLSFVGNDKF